MVEDNKDNSKDPQITEVFSPKEELPEYRLDTMFFRVQRGGKWVNRCFSDCTEEEIEFLTKGFNVGQWKRVAMYMRERLRAIGASGVWREESEGEDDE